MKAYVLIKTMDGSAAVSETLRSMPGIESVEEVSGALDAIAVADVDPDLLQSVVAQIRVLPGVLHVLPATLVDSLAPASASGVAAA